LLNTSVLRIAYRRNIKGPVSLFSPVTKYFVFAELMSFRQLFTLSAVPSAAAERLKEEEKFCSGFDILDGEQSVHNPWFTGSALRQHASRLELRKSGRKTIPGQTPSDEAWLAKH